MRSREGERAEAEATVRRLRAEVKEANATNATLRDELVVQSAAQRELEELGRRVHDLESLVKEQSSTIRRLQTVETDWKAKRPRAEQM
jgi:predicted RNase H-like nuclease (RuvC/YqgF family)